MSIIKKSFTPDFIFQHIRDLDISDKSKFLLRRLFETKTKEAAKDLQTLFSTSSSVSDVTITLIPAGILVCAYRTGYPEIESTKLKQEMDALFRSMGYGDGSRAKSAISDGFGNTIKHILSLGGIDASKHDLIVKNIQNRIGRISKWRTSADKVANHVIPIFEKVLSNAIYSNFYIAFSNRGKKDSEKPDLAQYVSSLPSADDRTSSKLNEYSYGRLYIPDTMQTLIAEEFCKMLGTSERISVVVSILKKNAPLGLKFNLADGYMKKAKTKDAQSLSLHYHVFYNNGFEVQIALSEGDVLRVLRETEGNPQECAKLFVEYTKYQLPEIVAELKLKKEERKREAAEEERKREQRAAEEKERKRKQREAAEEEFRRWQKEEQEKRRTYTRPRTRSHNWYDQFKAELERLQKSEDYSEDSVKKLKAIYDDHEEEFKMELRMKADAERKAVGKQLINYLFAAKKSPTGDFQFLEENLMRLRTYIVDI